MKIISLNINFIRDIQSLERESAPVAPYYMRYSVDDLNYLFHNRNTCGVYGVYFENKLIGWSSYRNHFGHLYEIGSLVVGKSYLRRGVGKKLLEQTVNKIIKKDIDAEIFLTVYPFNVKALLLYLRNHFRIYDFKKNYYGPNTDRLLLKYIKNCKGSSLESGNRILM